MVHPSLTTRLVSPKLFIDLAPSLISVNATYTGSLRAEFVVAPAVYLATDISLTVTVPYVPPTSKNTDATPKLPSAVNSAPFFIDELKSINASDPAANISYTFPVAQDLQEDNMTVSLSISTLGTVTKQLD